MGVGWKGEPMGMRLPLFGHHVTAPRPNEVTPEVNVTTSFIFGKKHKPGIYNRERRPEPSVTGVPFKKTSHRTKNDKWERGPGPSVTRASHFESSHAIEKSHVLKSEDCHGRPILNKSHAFETSHDGKKKN